MIRLDNVSKFYYSKGVIASGFSKVNLEFKMGEFVAITGESGSGKSTLLNVISGLDTYEEGEMYIDGKETSHYTEKDFENYRRRYIGNIFQNFNLVNSYTVYQNIELVLLLNGMSGKEVKDRVNELIDKVGLKDYKRTKASKLSGGQKQRVAIARALAKDTPIIIADEPTGNLDVKSAAEIIELLAEISKDKLVIIVTHNYEQVEKHVTRKIKMHDGKILEDSHVKTPNDVKDVTACELRDIKAHNEIRLGVRNAFNIVPKFLLLLFVFLFITVSLSTEYALFKHEEAEASRSGYNWVFNNSSSSRIIIKKNDKTAFSEEDYAKAEKISNIGRIVKNDIALDEGMYLTDGENIYYSGIVENIDEYDGKISVGRKAEKDDEVVIYGSKDNYYLENNGNKIIDTTLYFEDYNGDLDKTKPYKVVGIILVDNSEYDEVNYDGRLYFNSNVYDYINFKQNQNSSEMSVLFENKYYTSSLESAFFGIEPSDKVKPGEAIVSSDFNSYTEKGNAIGQNITINVENMFFEETLELKISTTYAKYTMKDILGVSNYDDLNGKIFINTDDYNSLFDKGFFQSSVFVKDEEQIDATIKSLNDLGFSTLKIKDTLVSGGEVELMMLMKTIVTAGLAIVLFFIAYFVIRIILKSRNVYYSTIRILGANTKTARNLLMIDLFTDANIAFLLYFCILKVLNLAGVNATFLTWIADYMHLLDYGVLYFIIVAISLLISLRYSNTLFKKSTMSTMREEV